MSAATIDRLERTTSVPPAGMRAIVCDDDSGVRRVVSDLVVARGGEVLAETDRAIDAIALIERFAPDLVVLDLALAQGSGLDVVDYLRGLADPPRVVMFTAFDDIAGITGGQDHFLEVLHKPDFERLDARLASTPARGAERRSSVRPVGAAPVVAADVLDDFYRMLASAAPDDVLLSLAVGDDATAALATVRGAIRGYDRAVLRTGQVLLLLVGGGAGAIDAVRVRLRDAMPDIETRLWGRDVGDDPAAVFRALTELTRG